MRKPRSCERCGVSRVVLVERPKIRQQGIGKAGPHSKQKALYFTILTLGRLCVPCLLKTIDWNIAWDAIPKEFKEHVKTEEDDEAQERVEARVLTREEVRQGKKLTRTEVRSHERRYGKHNFCYQCGSNDLAPVDDQHLHSGMKECRNCGSSDLDAG